MATLRKRDELFRNNLMRETERLGHTPKERLVALFDAMHAWFNESTFSGCMFINASAEFSELDNPNHLVCAEHKRLVRDYIKSLAQLANAKDPDELANQLNMIIEGAIVNAHVEGNKNAAKVAKIMGEVFINLAIKS